MTFHHWIVPEPDPRLSLRVSDIDLSKLDYDLVIFILSSSMKKYHHEFYDLPNFTSIVRYILDRHEIDKRLKIYRKCISTYGYCM
jgi:hypothetical protein